MSTVSQCVQCLSRIKISEATRWLFTRPSPLQLVEAGSLTSRTQQYRSGDAEKNPGATERREMSNDGASLHEPCEGRFTSDDARTTSMVDGDVLLADRAGLRRISSYGDVRQRRRGGRQQSVTPDDSNGSSYSRRYPAIILLVDACHAGCDAGGRRRTQRRRRHRKIKVEKHIL